MPPGRLPRLLLLAALALCHEAAQGVRLKPGHAYDEAEAHRLEWAIDLAVQSALQGGPAVEPRAPIGASRFNWAPGQQERDVLAVARERKRPHSAPPQRVDTTRKPVNKLARIDSTRTRAGDATAGRIRSMAGGNHGEAKHRPSVAHAPAAAASQHERAGSRAKGSARPEAGGRRGPKSKPVQRAAVGKGGKGPAKSRGAPPKKPAKDSRKDETTGNRVAHARPVSKREVAVGRPDKSSGEAYSSKGNTSQTGGVVLTRTVDDSALGDYRHFTRRELPLWLFGAHHKTGTWLISRLAKFQGDALREPMCSISSTVGPCGIEGRFGPSCWADPGFRTWFDCHMTGTSLAKVGKVADGKLRVVHIIRDPVAMVVSGYVYHTRTRSDDLAPGGLQGISLSEGLAREAEVALAYHLPEMLGAYRQGQASDNVLTVRLEDFMESSSSYDATVQRVYEFTVGDVLDVEALASLRGHAEREDLRRRPWTDHSTSITDPGLKREAELALASIPQEVLQKLLGYRRELGYA